ncbi:tetratricopeptide repeat protein [Brumimicrobium mesophilum]|uniref:tetratricopeptide repeat protein n=1 Tax=Brumimicrobium mesophilum TaxID=392717 RepID=UPI000D14358F|nr:tetratricopeptide repeat protein [Brumimicrobium mesophilum]
MTFYRNFYISLRFFSIVFIAPLFLITIEAQSENGIREIQLQKIHSIKAEINDDKKDLNYVYQHIELSQLLSSIEMYEEALYSINVAMEVSESLNQKKATASALTTLGSIYFDREDYINALPILIEADKELTKYNQEKDLSFNYQYLGETYLELGDTVSAISAHKKGLALCEKLNFQYREAFYSDYLGHIYFHQDNFELAIENFKRALRIHQQKKVSFKISLSAGNLGLSHLEIGNKREAIHYLLISKKYYEHDKNVKGVLWMNSLISDVYKEIREFEKALEFNNNNIEICKDISDTLRLAIAYKQRGEISTAHRKYKKSEYYLDKARFIFEKLNEDKHITELLISTSNLYFESKNYPKAIKFLNQARILNDKNIKDHKLSIDISRIYGGILAKTGQAEKAKVELEHALAHYISSKSRSHLPFIYQHLFIADSILNDYPSALKNYKLYTANFIKENRDQLDTERLAYQFEFEKKEAIAEVKLETKNAERNLAIVLLVLTSLLTIIIIYFFRLRQKNIKIQQKNIEFEKREVDQIKKTEEFKSRFLTNITHEFRTPLTLIKGHLEILKTNTEIGEEKRLVEMENSSDRLLQLINQLMELSRMEEGKYQLHYQKGFLMKTLLKSKETFETLAKQKNITYNYQNKLDENFDIENFVYSQEAIATIVSNLLSNALKFTPNNGQIELILGNIDEETIFIHVNDSGLGISPDDINNIFERFYQVETEKQRTFEGSGIGLAFVKELALLHGGSVKVESIEGDGAKFTVTLKSGQFDVDSLQPKIESSLAANISYSDTSQHNSEEAKSDKPIILVVEDQIEIRKLITESLNENYQFLEAENGRKGIELAEKCLPDLIISDVMMPVTDGLELSKELKNNIATSHIPIILLTAKSDMKDKISGLEIGVDDYLTKPFLIAEIKLKIRNILLTRENFRRSFNKNTIISKDENISKFNDKEREFIEKIEKIVFSNINNQQFGVPELAEEMYLSSSQITRKLNSLIDTSPAKYIRNIRLEKAKELLKNGYNVSETAWEVGYEDPVYFSKTFKKHFGVAPSLEKK